MPAEIQLAVPDLVIEFDSIALTAGGSIKLELGFAKPELEILLAPVLRGDPGEPGAQEWASNNW